MIEVVDQIGDWRWRLCNLYKVRNEQNEVVRFIPKTEQIDLLSSMCGWDIILKARQLGFTTLIDIFALDQAFFADIAAAIIAHGASEVEKIFRNKVRFPYEQLPEQLRADNPTNNDSANELVFVKGGSIYVANSARSGTLQFLHVSEMGKIARRFPERSREIVTGSFPTIHEGGMVFVESTAEGTGGDFYDLVKGAEKTDASIKASKRPRQRMEFKLHFYPWWKEPKYQLNPEGVAINAEMAKYFLSLEKVYGITLTAEQAAWYVVMERLQRADMKREYPSTIDEAFEGANEERYFAQQMSKARREGRIKQLPYLPGRGVNLFFDIGRDTTCFWAHQYVNTEHRLVGYYGETGKEFDHFQNVIQERRYLLRNIYLPHDGDQKRSQQPGALTPKEVWEGMFPGVKVRVVTRVSNKSIAINAARNRLHECWIDENECATGIVGLDNYRKKWSESLGNWLDEPRHDIHSHPADAFQTFACGWEPSHEQRAALTPGRFPGLTSRAGAYAG
jgi:hypothetical protein